MSEAIEKLKNAMRQEMRTEKTKEDDRARYEAANTKLIEATDAGGGFADALTDFMRNIEDDPVIELIRKADPENRAALMEVLNSFKRFGISPQIEERFPRAEYGV